MIFFITGASSFIGIELCRYLTECGHKVIAMSRKNNKHLSDIADSGSLQVLYADLQKLKERVVDIKADVFIHLAWAGTSHEERNISAIHEENVQMSLECVRLAKRMGCSLYVDAGSQAEYGIVSGTITEETSCNPISAYGKGKLKMYQDTKALTEQLDMKYIHLRIFSVYGENDHDDTLIKSAMRKLKAGELFEMRSGGQKWNYLYVGDAARQIAELSLYAFAKSNFSCEVYNIASEDTRQLKDFVIAMKEIVNSSSELRFGGYDREKDVNLAPDISKLTAIVSPITKYKFENMIRKIA